MRTIIDWNPPSIRPPLKSFIYVLIKSPMSLTGYDVLYGRVVFCPDSEHDHFDQMKLVFTVRCECICMSCGADKCIEMEEIVGWIPHQDLYKGLDEP